MNERLPLSQLLIESAQDTEPVVPFAATFGDDVKIVTAVLERTAVLSEPSDRYDRKSVRHDQVLVDPAVITWRTRTSEYDGHRILSTGLKPGSEEAKAAMHVMRKSPNRWRRSKPINPANLPGAEARQASDERALKNQQEVKDTKQRELAAHRQQSQKRHEEEAMSTSIVITGLPPAPPVIDQFLKKAKCFTCKQEKLVDEFPAPIHRGPNICTRCAESKSTRAETITQTSATTAITAPKPRLKKGRATTGKPRRGKKIKLGETALLVSKGPHDNVLRLLEKRDSLRLQLTDVLAQLAEAIAG